MISYRRCMPAVVRAIFTGGIVAAVGARRMNCRANRVPGDIGGRAIRSGVLGLVAIVLFQRIMHRMVFLPLQHALDIASYPILTVFVWVCMAAVVAGGAEESIPYSLAVAAVSGLLASFTNSILPGDGASHCRKRDGKV